MAGSTAVGVAINTTQIIALLIFSVMAITHRVNHPEGSAIWVLDSTGTPTQYNQDAVPDTTKTIPDPKDATKQIQDPNATVPKVKKSDGTTPVWTYATADGTVVPTDDEGTPKVATATPQLFKVSYKGGITTDAAGVQTFNFHETLGSVVAPHKAGYVVIQACIAILILVGFESVTSMGEEAVNAKRDIPRAVILSLVDPGRFLLPVRVLCGELLSEQRLHRQYRRCFFRAHR